MILTDDPKSASDKKNTRNDENSDAFPFHIKCVITKDVPTRLNVAAESAMILVI